MKKKIERVCHFKKLKIRQNGDIFPCCTSWEHTYLGNIFDENIFEIIENTCISCECETFKSIPQKEGEKPKLKYIHFEASNLCQASCLCCPQSKEKMPKEKLHLNRIRYFIDYYKPQIVNAIGGEILVQKEAMAMLFELSEKYPKMKFQTISNLSVPFKIIKKAEEIFEKITVSFLGFQPYTYKNEMGLDYALTICNFNYLYENKKVKLMPKFLAMPTNLFEIALFLEWAIRLDVEKIYLHNIYEFKEVANLENVYWQKTFDRLSIKMKKIFEENHDLLLSKKRHFISIHALLAEYLHIDFEYLKNNKLSKIVKIVN